MNKTANTLLNSIESNPSNYSNLKDWGIELTYGGEFANSTTSNLYLLSLSKRIGHSNFSLRYTPGYQKDFIFNSGESIILNDSSTQTLSSKFIYKEIFGFGYSYQITDKLSFGFTTRLFNQEFNNEVVEPVFSDSLFFNLKTETEKINFWKTDFGINFSPVENISFSVASINLIDVSSKTDITSNSAYEIRRPKGVLIGAYISPIKQISFNFLYETTQSFMAGIEGTFDLPNGSIGLSVTAMHDKYQSPYIAGMLPAISYQSKVFGITLSGVKYFRDKNTTQSFSVFENEGIRNILNNRYSFDKVTLTITFRLNTITEEKAKILSIEIVQEIFPAFEDNYLDKPFALGRVVNKTDKRIRIKPSSKIIGFNRDIIYSPSVSITAYDTVEVPFYTIVPDTYSNKQNKVSYADFYISTRNNETDDKLQKPILINKINAWDGKVFHLKEFIKKDQNYLMKYAKEILSENKSKLDTIVYFLTTFYKAKILFNNLFKKFVYVADPNATSDFVQFPKQTINLKGGDCDDLSVLYSAVLESVGIQTALIDYKPEKGLGHVNLLFNTELSPRRAKWITDNDSKYFIRKNSKGKDQVWIAIETTSLTGFMKAWELGIEKFNNEAINKLGLAKGKVEIVDVQ
ncbi:MAG: transglutaminase domain-containing protein [Bacteroidetes bacterium]|nr:transglutaminase domain-containing protein [Bacteroidota bacterium]